MSFVYCVFLGWEDKPLAYVAKGGQYTKIDSDFKQDIPQYEIDALARCILPKIQAYFESEEGRKEFERWKLNQKKK